MAFLSLVWVKRLMINDGGCWMKNGWWGLLHGRGLGDGIAWALEIADKWSGEQSCRIDFGFVLIKAYFTSVVLYSTWKREKDTLPLPPLQRRRERKEAKEREEETTPLSSYPERERKLGGTTASRRSPYNPFRDIQLTTFVECCCFFIIYKAIIYIILSYVT